MAFYGSNRIQQILGYLKTYLGQKFASKTDLTSHVSTDGQPGVKGHVSIYNGDVSGKTYTSGEAAASAHTHDSRYMLSSEQAKLNNAYALARSLATLEENARASKPYAVGDWLVYGGQLYEVTVAMAALDDFVFSGANQNVNAITMEQVISDIEGTDISGKCDLTNIADVFNTTSTYSKGTWVIYNGQLYKCTTQHSGAWDDSHFSAGTVEEFIPDNILRLHRFQDRGKNVSISSSTPSQTDKTVDGITYHCYEFDTEYSLTVTPYRFYSGFYYMLFNVILNDTVYRKYTFCEASPYECEFGEYPFCFPILDPEGNLFVVRFYDIDVAAGTSKMKITYSNGYSRAANTVYLSISGFETC